MSPGGPLAASFSGLLFIAWCLLLFVLLEAPGCRGKIQIHKMQKLNLETSSSSISVGATRGLVQPPLDKPAKSAPLQRHQQELPDQRKRPKALEQPELSYPYAGFRALFSPIGISQVVNDFSGLLEDEIVATKLSNIDGETGTPIGIKIKYELENIVLSEWKFGPIETQIIGNAIYNTGLLRVTMTEISFRVDLHFHYTALLIQGSGTATIYVTLKTGVDLVFTNQKGDPVVLVVAVDVQTSHFDIQLHGGDSWFYSVFVGLFHSKIESAFDAAIQQNVKSAIADIQQKYISNLPTVLKVNDVVSINYGLTLEPVNPYTAYYGLITNHIGQFFWNGGPTTCIQPSFQMLPDLGSLGARGLQVMLWEGVGSWLACSYFDARLLKYTLDQADLPPNFPIQLNTSQVQFILPQLYNKYPNDAVVIDIVATSPPGVYISPKGIDLEIRANLTVCVLVKGNKIPAFTLGVHTAIDFLANFSNNNLTANFTNYNVDVYLLWSGIGPFNTSLIAFMVNMLVGQGVMPALNQYGHVGFPVPFLSSKIITLANTNLEYLNGYLIINTDFVVHPTTTKKRTNTKWKP